ncbi:phospholipase A2-like isoform X2 [Clytia hemisphaerica]|uniref:phospholipase A2-like isoform X2 n=1 Tax=Clytia hemisphaerica TaxID=252671 RepID=UPI0034D62E44|eukprot:TCONS_00009903-protein
MWLSTFVFALSCALQVSGFLAQNRTTFTASRNHYHDANAAKRLTMWGMFWCGNYDQATKSAKYNTESSEINKCCMAHDTCPLFIDDGYTRWGLSNTVGIKTNWCGCDRAFMTCLREVGSAPARAIGSLYFNVRRAPCFNLQKDAKKKERQKKTKKATNIYDSKDSIDYDKETGHYLRQGRTETQAFFVEPPFFTVSPKQDVDILKVESELWDKIIDNSEYQGEVVANTGPSSSKKTEKKTKGKGRFGR